MRSTIRIIHSDLFDNIPLEAFDIIAINPPYYKKDPHAPAEYAWFCGKKGEYFERLFTEPWQLYARSVGSTDDALRWMRPGHDQHNGHCERISN